MLGRPGCGCRPHVQPFSTPCSLLSPVCALTPALALLSFGLEEAQEGHSEASTECGLCFGYDGGGDP